MSRPVTVDVREMQQAFTKANKYLANMPIATDKTPENIQDKLNLAAAKWEKYFGVKVKVVWGTDIMTFTFKDKAAFMLFMLEWS